MRHSIVKLGLLGFVIFGCSKSSDEAPLPTASPVAAPELTTPPLSDPCEVEFHKILQLDILQDRKEQAEIDEDLRRKFIVTLTPETIATLLPLKDRLQHLQISTYDVSKADLQIISQCTQLESLNLSYCHIDDDDLETLRPCLSNLKLLWLTYDQLTDRSMTLISSIRSLEILGLTASEITDDGAAQLAALSNLKQLQISSMHLTNHAVASLAVLEKMRMFSVGGDGINDDCLNDLLRFPNLRVAGIKLSKEAADRLRTESPKYGQFELPELPDGPPIKYYKLDCIDGWDFKILRDARFVCAHR